MKFEDLTGKKFGRMLVVNRAPNNKHGHTFYNCLCDCGEKRICSAADLKRGHRQSCGCLRKEVCGLTHRLPEGEAAFNNLYSAYRRGAKDRGFIFNLTPESFKTIVAGKCHYCGAGPSLKIYNDKTVLAKGVNGNFIYTGVDRKDNNAGYTVENSVPCCKICNFAKGTMSYDEFLTYIQRLVAFNKVS